jgi:GT2 family glycosyltransferase
MNCETKLSIVIVNYNVKYFLELCLYAVRAATEALDAEVFVVDNHSTDGSVAYLRPKFPEVIFIENQDNPGFAKANNQAIRRSKGEYVLLLNPDTVIGEDGLRTLCYFMDEHPKAGALGVKMINGHGVFLPESKRSFPTPWVSFCKLFGLSKLFPRSKRFAAYSLPYLNPDLPHRVEVLSGAFMLLRRRALDETGLLDEAFFMYGEDIDLSYRMILSGYKNYYFPERILHYKGESTKKGDQSYLRAFYGAMLIFYRKYYPDSGKWISWMIRRSITLRQSYAALFERKKKKNGAGRNIKYRRLLIFCRNAHFEEIKAVALKYIPELKEISRWDPDEKRIMKSLNHRTRSHPVTDMIFCHPDVSFDQMLLLMDRMVEKTMCYHIYLPDSGLLVPEGKILIPEGK